MEGNGGDLELALHGPLIQAFDVFLGIDELDVRRRLDLAVQKGVEHEGVVGVGRMGDANGGLMG
jgi:hypothetical protein